MYKHSLVLADVGLAPGWRRSSVCRRLICWIAGGSSYCRLFFFFFQAEDGIRDYKVTGVQTCALPIYGQHLLPRNAQIAELAGLLYARGIRVVTLNPGMTAEHVLALFSVAMGTILPDDAALGRVTLTLGRRSSQRLERLRTPTPAAGSPALPEAMPAAPLADGAPPGRAAPAPVAPPPPAPSSSASASPDNVMGRRAGVVFRPDALPADVEVKRAVAALRSAATPEEQRAAVEVLQALTPKLLALHDTAPVAAAIAALDRMLTTAQEPVLLEAIDKTAVALSDRPLVQRMVQRLGEPRVPPEEREALVPAGGAPAAVSVPLVLDAFLATAVDLRPPYRACIRKAADRALEPLQGRLADNNPEVAAAAAEFISLTGSPQAVALLLPLLRHASEFVREAALIGLTEAGGGMNRRSTTVRAAAIEGLGHIARPEARGLLELYSKDKEPTVRKAAEAALR